MKHLPHSRYRRSIRLKGYDYSQPGAYFVTICSHRRAKLFGNVLDGKVILNRFGRIVKALWLRIPEIRPHVAVDEYIVMPNHVHGILMIHSGPEKVGATHWVAPTKSARSAGLPPNSLGVIIGQFKSVATKQINNLRSTGGKPVWQRNYFEHIIRDDRALNRLREYIHYNPQRWHQDKYNPAATGPDKFDAWMDGNPQKSG